MEEACGRRVSNGGRDRWTCAPGYADCNAVAEDGCEINVRENRLRKPSVAGSNPAAGSTDQMGNFLNVIYPLYVRGAQQSGQGRSAADEARPVYKFHPRLGGVRLYT